jgi:plasmid replication initiation protein
MIVSAGFIVGFDNDRSNIFEQQINFIQKSGIASAMVGLLNAPTGTKLFKRLKAENRLLEIFSGNNMDGSINFIPKMNYSDLIKGYTKILNTIYSQKEYYLRIKQFLNEYRIPSYQLTFPSLNEVIAFIKLVYRLGFMEKGKKYFWKLLALSLIKHPRKFSLAMTFAVYGFHFRKVTAAV